MITVRKWMCCAALGLVLTGCDSIGPRQIHLDRNRYADVVQDTDNQQLLTNILRICYLEPVSFLKITSVTSSYELNPSLTSNAGISSLQNSFGLPPARTFTSNFITDALTRSANVAPQVSYHDKPTISYAPVVSGDFVHELLTPVSLLDLHLLSYGGLNDIAFLFRITVQSMDGLDNASSASNPKTSYLPKYQDFYQFLDCLTSLIQRGGVELLSSRVHGELAGANSNSKTINNNVYYALTIHFSREYANSPEANQLRRMLGVPPSRDDIVLTEAFDAAGGNIVFTQMRSLLGIMSFLSHGVQVPQSDIQAGYVYQYIAPNGQLYNWAPLMKDLFTVYSSDSEPMDAFVKVLFHDHWFYIKNCDLDSKATFSLLVRLTTITAGQALNSGPAPVLTVPV